MLIVRDIMGRIVDDLRDVMNIILMKVLEFSLSCTD